MRKMVSLLWRLSSFGTACSIIRTMPLDEGGNLSSMPSAPSQHASQQTILIYWTRWTSTMPVSLASPYASALVFRLVLNISFGFWSHVSLALTLWLSVCRLSLRASAFRYGLWRVAAGIYWYTYVYSAFFILLWLLLEVFLYFIDNGWREKVHWK